METPLVIDFLFTFCVFVLYKVATNFNFKNRFRRLGLDFSVPIRLLLKGHLVKFTNYNVQDDDDDKSA